MPSISVVCVLPLLSGSPQLSKHFLAFSGTWAILSATQVLKTETVSTQNEKDKAW